MGRAHWAIRILTHQYVLVELFTFAVSKLPRDNNSMCARPGLRVLLTVRNWFVLIILDRRVSCGFHLPSTR